MSAEATKKYNVWLDYKPYLIEKGSYKIQPAPQFASRFQTGRPSYSTLDFWQVDAMTDWSKGMGQEYLVAPDISAISVGIDCSQPGEIKLERRLESVTPPSGDNGAVKCHYRNLDKLYLGTETGKIISTTDGVNWTVEKDTGSGPIYQFYEIDGKLWASKGKKAAWVYSNLRKFLYQESGSVNYAVGSDYFIGQTIIPDEDREIEYVRLYLKKRIGKKIGELTLSVYECGEDHLPKKETVNEEEVIAPPIAEAYHTAIGNQDLEWKTFHFDPKCVLESGKEYAFVIWVNGGDSASIWARYNNSSAIGLGVVIMSNDGGETYSVLDSSASLVIQFWDEGTSYSWQELGPEGLYYVETRSIYSYGLFDDGIRQSLDGITWVPEPPDPLWGLPSGQDIPNGAVSIPRGFILGFKRSLYNFTGGSSTVCLYQDDYNSSTENFKAISKVLYYAVFGIENQGLFYTDGISIKPSNLNFRSKTVPVTAVRGVLKVGWDLFALVKYDSDWYLARTNLANHDVPSYFWFVQKLEKEPVHLSAFSKEKIFIHYDDESIDKYNLESGPYQSSGYLITPRIDQGLIKLRKVYYSISVLASEFPTDTKIKLSYSIDQQGFNNSKEFEGQGSEDEKFFILPNPSIGREIKIKVELSTTAPNKTPIITDLMWKYILERASEEQEIKKTFSFTVIAEENLDDLDGDPYPYSAGEIIENLWNSKQKQEILNFVGDQNKKTFAFTISSTLDHYLYIDQTNYTLITKDADGTEQHKIEDLNEKTISEIVSTINGWENYTCEISKDIDPDTKASNLMPIYEIGIKGGKKVFSGTDIHRVIFYSQAPSQLLLEPEHDSNRLNISLREA